MSFSSLVRSLIPSIPASTSAVRTGSILVSGYNFGTGSSREQAATALLNAGIPLVICGSFGDIFKRNSINNGLICVECPELVRDLTKEFGKDGERGNGGKDGEGTVRPGWEVVLDMARAELKVVKAQGEEAVYKVGAVGKSVQEIVRISSSRLVVSNLELLNKLFRINDTSGWLGAWKDGLRLVYSRVSYKHGYRLFLWTELCAIERQFQTSNQPIFSTVEQVLRLPEVPCHPDTHGLACQEKLIISSECLGGREIWNEWAEKMVDRRKVIH